MTFDLNPFYLLHIYVIKVRYSLTNNVGCRGDVSLYCWVAICLPILLQILKCVRGTMIDKFDQHMIYIMIMNFRIIHFNLFTGVNGSGIQLTFTIAPGGAQEPTIADAMQKVQDNIAACTLRFIGSNPEQRVLTSTQYCAALAWFFTIPDGKSSPYQRHFDSSFIVK